MAPNKEDAKRPKYSHYPDQPSASSSGRPPAPSPTTSRYWRDVMSIDPRDRPGSSHRGAGPSVPPESRKTRGSESKSSRSANEPKEPKEPKTPASRLFYCPRCPSRFERRGHLEDHIETVHEHKRPHACTEPGCSKVFGHRSSLQRHIKTNHLPPDHPDRKSSRKRSAHHDRDHHHKH